MAILRMIADEAPAAPSGTGCGVAGMRKIGLFIALIVTLAVAYVTAPLLTAWNIREAVKSGDAAYLSGKIEWPRVKETLKASLAASALDLPPQAGNETTASTSPKPSLWQRFKAWAGKGAIDRMVDNYANAEGLPQLFSWRQTYRSAVGHAEEPKTLANLPGRIWKAWSRVRRAEFTSPTRFEVEMVDRYDTDRLFSGTLELTGLEWKLVSVHVRRLEPDSLTGAGPPPGTGGGIIARLRGAAVPRLALDTHDER